MARPKYPSDDIDKTMVRFPTGLMDRIKIHANANGRSMNNQIIRTLEAAFQTDDDEPGDDMPLPDEKIANIAPFGLRMQPHLKASVEAAAAANHRSMNAEIIARIEARDETLRDRFAMAALTGITPGTPALAERSVYALTATLAYELADAMMAERQKVRR